MANYILRNADDGLWSRFKAKATEQGHALRWVILRLIEGYAAGKFKL